MLTPSSRLAGHRRARPQLARLALVCLPVASMLTALPGPAPAAATAPAAAPLDLAAMAVWPFDVPGQPFVYNYGTFYTPGGHRAAEYNLEIAIVDPATGDTINGKVVSWITQFTDPTAAQRDLDATIEHASANSQIAAGAPVIGEASAVYTSHADSGDGPIDRAEAAIRVGTVVAEISLIDFTGAAPSVDEIVALGNIVAGRITTGQTQGLPGLGNRMLLLGESDQYQEDTSRAYYAQVDGLTTRTGADTDETFQERASLWTDAGIDDVFVSVQDMAHASGDPAQALSYVARVNTFANDQTAAAFVPTALQWFTTDSAGYSNIVPVTVSGFPGATAAASYDYQREDGSIASGFRIWAQAGTSVVMVEIDRVGGVTVEGASSIALAEVACVTSGTCPTIPVPPALTGS